MGDDALIVADTQALLWLDGGSDELGSQARALLDDALDDGELAVSAITYCEVAWLQLKRRITLRLPVRAWRESLEAQGLAEVPVAGPIAIAAVELERLHGDPADRLIVATAAHHDAILVTSDTRILRWIGALTRIDARR